MVSGLDQNDQANKKNPKTTDQVTGHTDDRGEGKDRHEMAHRQSSEKCSGEVHKPGTDPTQDRDCLNQMRGSKETPASLPKISIEGLTPEHKERLTKDAEAIHKAITREDSWFGGVRGVDTQAIDRILKDKTDAERKEIGDIYLGKHEISLDAAMRKNNVSGSDLEHFHNTFHRKDGDAASQSAGRVAEGLSELNNWVTGRSASVIEKDIRDSVSSLNPEQIQKMQQDYLDRYEGKDRTSLYNAIVSNPNLSAGTKDFVKHFLQPADQRTPDGDTRALTDIALRENNIDIFSEVMKNASPEARQEFFANGGSQKLKDRFSGRDLQRAQDYAASGELSESTQIRNNSGSITRMFTNQQGVELAIKGMSAEDRRQYAEGKELSAKGPDLEKLSPEQIRSAGYYMTVRDALGKAGNPTDVAKWEDMIATKDGSFVSSLAKHRGMLWNNSSAEIAKDIDSMSEKDWRELKSHPERRGDFENMVKTLDKSPEEVKQLLSMYDAKLKPESYQQAKDVNLLSLDDRINDHKHWNGADQADIISALEKMTPKEQERYRNDADFRKNLNAQVDSTLSDSYLDSAKAMLTQVDQGKQPKEDVVDKLKHINSGDAAGTIKAVNAIEAAFKDDPGLRERINNPNPNNPEEVAYSAKFRAVAFTASLGDHSSIVKPLLETGQAPLAARLTLHDGTFNDDVASICKDVNNAITPEERQKLKADPAFTEKFKQENLGLLSKEQQQVVIAAARQGEMQAEDKIRATLLGWGGSSDIAAELEKLQPRSQSKEDIAKSEAALAKLQIEYASKYNSSLVSDLHGKLGSADYVKAERVLTAHLDGLTRSNLARDEVHQTLTGVGNEINTRIFRSATGEQTLNANEKLVKATKDLNDSLANLPPAVQNQIVQHSLNEAVQLVQQARDNNAASKQAAAENVAMATATAAGIGTVVLTGGASGPLVAASLRQMAMHTLKQAAIAGTLGALADVTANKVMQGNDHDDSATNLGKRLAVGGTTGMGAALGGEQAAALFGMGKAAAKEATATVVAGLTKETAAVVSEEALARGLENVFQQGLVAGVESGAKLNRALLGKAAEEAVSTGISGEARQTAVNAVRASIESIAEQEYSGITRKATQQMLANATSGGATGAGEAILEGAASWNPDASVESNVSNILVSAAGASTLGFVSGAGANILARGGAELISRGETKAGESVAREVGEGASRGHLSGARSALREKGKLIADGAATVADQNVSGMASPAVAHGATTPHPPNSPNVTVGAIADAAAPGVDRSHADAAPGGPHFVAKAEHPVGSAASGLANDTNRPDPRVFDFDDWIARGARADELPPISGGGGEPAMSGHGRDNISNRPTASASGAGPISNTVDAHAAQPDRFVFPDQSQRDRFNGLCQTLEIDTRNPKDAQRAAKAAMLCRGRFEDVRDPEFFMHVPVEQLKKLDESREIGAINKFRVLNQDTNGNYVIDAKRMENATTISTNSKLLDLNIGDQRELLKLSTEDVNKFAKLENPQAKLDAAREMIAKVSNVDNPREAMAIFAASKLSQLKPEIQQALYHRQNEHLVRLANMDSIDNVNSFIDSCLTQGRYNKNYPEAKALEIFSSGMNKKAPEEVLSRYDLNQLAQLNDLSRTNPKAADTLFDYLKNVSVNDRQTLNDWHRIVTELDGLSKQQMQTIMNACPVGLNEDATKAIKTLSEINPDVLSKNKIEATLDVVAPPVHGRNPFDVLTTDEKVAVILNCPARQIADIRRAEEKGEDLAKAAAQKALAQNASSPPATGLPGPPAGKLHHMTDDPRDPRQGHPASGVRDGGISSSLGASQSFGSLLAERKALLADETMQKRFEDLCSKAQVANAEGLDRAAGLVSDPLFARLDADRLSHLMRLQPAQLALLRESPRADQIPQRFIGLLNSTGEGVTDDMAQSAYHVVSSKLRSLSMDDQKALLKMSPATVESLAKAVESGTEQRQITSNFLGLHDYISQNMKKPPSDTEALALTISTSKLRNLSADANTARQYQIDLANNLEPQQLNALASIDDANAVRDFVELCRSGQSSYDGRWQPDDITKGLAVHGSNNLRAELGKTAEERARNARFLLKYSKDDIQKLNQVGSEKPEALRDFFALHDRLGDTYTTVDGRTVDMWDAYKLKVLDGVTTTKLNQLDIDKRDALLTNFPGGAELAQLFGNESALDNFLDWCANQPVNSLRLDYKISAAIDNALGRIP